MAQLVNRAKAGGLALTGEGGVLAQLTKRLLESALEGEITDHLGYDKHDPAGRGTGNSRNGTRGSTPRWGHLRVIGVHLLPLFGELKAFEGDQPEHRDGNDKDQHAGGH
jgi:hypothetical protein